jgi:hypothetical protein
LARAGGFFGAHAGVDPGELGWGPRDQAASIRLAARQSLPWAAALSAAMMAAGPKPGHERQGVSGEAGCGFAFAMRAGGLRASGRENGLAALGDRRVELARLELHVDGGGGFGPALRRPTLRSNSAASAQRVCAVAAGARARQSARPG